LPLAALVVLLQLGGSGIATGLLEKMTPEWKRIVALTDPYVFIRLWDLPGFCHFFSALVFFFVVRKEFLTGLPAEKRRFFRLWILAPLLLFILSFVAVDLLGLGFFAGLQLSRSLILWKIILPITFAFYAFRHVKEQPNDLLFNFFLAAILFSLLLFELVGLVFLPGFFLLWLKKNYGNRSRFTVVNKLLARINGLVVLSLTLIIAAPYSIASARITDSLAWAVEKFLILVALSLAGIFLWHWWNRRQKAATTDSVEKLFGLTAAITLLLLSTLFLYWKPIAVQPTILNDPSFLEVCDWLKNNTGKDDVVFSEPYSNLTTPLRYFCHKVVFGARDGTQSVFSRSYAMEWARRKELFNKLEDGDKIKTALAGENIGYVLASQEVKPLEKTLVFSSGQYRIYKLKK
jgi:hypothetical protein